MNFSKKIRNYSSDEEEVSLVGSNSSLIDTEDEDVEYQPVQKRSRTKTIKNVDLEKIQRRPTRVPNLKIQNRNALLARENRKRKKEMMESMEKTVEELQTQNKLLLKMMKSRDKKNEMLTKEVRYLKSVIANKTEIVSVLKSLPNFTAKNERCETIKECSPATSSETGYSDTVSCTSASVQNGSKIQEDPFLPTYIDDFFFTDIEVATNWDEILQNPFSSATDFSDFPKLDETGPPSPALSPLSEISADHNYSNYDKSIEDDSAGICVHINRGKVSLEFCAVCHYNSTSSWVDSSN
jgi:ATF/CREB family transcription factor